MRMYAIKNTDLFFDVQPDRGRTYIIRLRDLPSEKKPREKFLALGASTLSISELIEVIIGVGTTKEDVRAMSERILREYGEKSLAGVTNPALLSKDLDIPPGEENVRSEAYYRLTKPARLTAFQPHMHNRGKAQCIEAIYPDLRVEQLSCVNHYNFGWQVAYNYANRVWVSQSNQVIRYILNYTDSN